MYSYLKSAAVAGLALAVLGINTTPAKAQTVSVNCNKPNKTVAAALASGAQVVQIQGNCHENVVITRNDVSLVGITGNAKVTATDSTRPTILIVGAVRVVIESLTVQDGRTGVTGTRGAAFTVRTSVLKDNTRAGILARQASSVVVDENDIHSNGDPALDGGGVVVRLASSAVIRNNRIGVTDFGIMPNVFEGVLVDGSSAVIRSNRIVGNSSGIRVTNAGSALVKDNRLQLHEFHGIQVSENGSAILTGNFIELNEESQIGLFRNGYLRTTGPNSIEGNGRSGAVEVAQSSAISLRGGDTVDGNATIQGNSFADLRDLTIEDFSGGGELIVIDHSFAQLRNTAIATEVFVGRDSALEIFSGVTVGGSIFCGDLESSVGGNPDVLGGGIFNCTDFDQVPLP